MWICVGGWAASRRGHGGCTRGSGETGGFWFFTSTVILSLLIYTTWYWPLDLQYNWAVPSFTEIRITSRESPTIFSTSSFSSFEPTWATHQWVKIFSIWLRILIFVTFCDTNHSNVFLKMGVDSVGSWVTPQDWLYGVCDPEEIDSPGYQTPGSHVLADFLLLSTCTRETLTVKNLRTGKLSHRSPWNQGETHFPGY